MNINELMLGDFVRVHDKETEDDFIGRIYYLEAGYAEIGVSRCHHSVGYPYPVDCIEPIPLTPEILEKNGWKHKYYGIYRQTIGETITIDIFPEGCSVEDDRGSQNLYRLRYHLPALKFVHELQHALRLCGIEKEIEL